MSGELTEPKITEYETATSEIVFTTAGKDITQREDGAQLKQEYADHLLGLLFGGATDLGGCETPDAQ